MGSIYRNTTDLGKLDVVAPFDAAKTIIYDPADETDWPDPVPFNVEDALDSIADKGGKDEFIVITEETILEARERYILRIGVLPPT